MSCFRIFGQKYTQAHARVPQHSKYPPRGCSVYRMFFPRGQSRGKQHRGLRTKALMWDLGTRLECRHRVFARTGKTLWK